jgi:hypothetical protein
MSSRTQCAKPQSKRLHFLLYQLLVFLALVKAAIKISITKKITFFHKNDYYY